MLNTEPLPLPGTFTPVFDSLLRELGLSSALVYGVIWRCCQMEQNVCRASLETLAKRTRLSRSSVIRHIKTLLRQGYITDLTPNLKHAPHTYLVGRDPGIPTDAPMPEDADGSDGQAVQGCQKVHSEGTQDYPRCDKTSQQVCQNVAPGVTNCHTNKTLLRESLRDDLRDSQAPKFSKPSKTIFEALNRHQKELERNQTKKLPSHLGEWLGVRFTPFVPFCFFSEPILPLKPACDLMIHHPSNHDQ